MPHQTLPMLRIAALIAVLAGSAIAVPAAATDRVVIVRAGDTLSEIALAQGLTVEQLRALNGISDPNRIYVGQRLRLSGAPATTAPAAKARPKDVVHIVAWGETLTSIAHHYGSTIAAIAAANRIADPSYLRVGQRLTIPTPPGGTGPATTAPAAKARPKGVVHVVAGGETLTSIAHHYGSTIAAIAAANGIADPSYLCVGQRLTIPGAGPVAPVTGAARVMPAEMASLVAARDGIGRIIRAEAKSAGVPVALALAVAWQESGWRARVVSAAGAVGVMQLTPSTADWVASTMLGRPVNLYDARSNVRAGIVLLRHYLHRYHGDRSLVLAAYYQGQTAADLHGVYAVTRPYIAAVRALEKLFGG
ncbi:MAG TPA: LysM peptidoglycan-binding domain-containing protein [Candidatus Limnocylindria bacterium]